MAFHLLALLPKLGQFFPGLMSGRNTNLQLAQNEALEKKRLAVSRDLAAMQAQNQRNIAEFQAANQARIAVFQADMQREQAAIQAGTQKEIAAANLAFQDYRLQKEQALQRELASANLAFQTERMAKEQALQRELAELNYQRQMEIAMMQRETALQLPEVHKLFENWPLRIVPAQIINAFPGKKLRPLRVLLSPPAVEFDKFVAPNPQQQQSTAGNFPKLEKRLAESLRTLLNTHYPQTSSERPVELLDGAWDSSKYHGGSSLRALYSMLGSEPVVLLDAEADGDCLNFRVGYWGLAQETYAYESVFSGLPYREILYASAKQRALQWKTEVRDKLLALGEELKVINESHGGDNAINLGILEQDEKYRAAGVVVERHYRVNQADWEVLCQVLSTYHAVTLGVIADGHFLLHHDTPPKFMTCLTDWLKPQLGLTPESITEWLVARYDDMFQALQEERGYRVPLLRLELATSLATIAPVLARQQVMQAVQQQFAGRVLIIAGTQLWDIGRLLAGVTTAADEVFLTALLGGLQALQEDVLVAQVMQIEQIRLFEAAAAEVKRKQQHAALVIESIHGWSADKVQALQRRTAEFLQSPVEFQHNLKSGGKGPLMVVIPAGSFMMGAPDNEPGRRSHEGPQHVVTLAKPFAMGKFAVTFEDYDRFCAATGNSKPGDQGWGRGRRPVISVRWEDAVAYCTWLSEQTGYIYRLSSEAEWEYACRAGTTTKYSFGNDAKQLSDYAWFNNNSGSQTHPVGDKLPNPWGLYDMHGNVWEWCQDKWHGNYDGATTDGSAWESGDSASRLLRGCSWGNDPDNCRAANRVVNTDPNTYGLGFRVVVRVAGRAV